MSKLDEIRARDADIRWVGPCGEDRRYLLSLIDELVEALSKCNGELGCKGYAALAKLGSEEK
jgi:hypothetical protein